MKVLILAYDFPPYVSVGGLRPYSWYRYLGEFGVEPVVVTRQWANDYGDERDYIAPSATPRVEVEEDALGTVIRTPYAPNLANRLLLEGGPTRHPWVRTLTTAFYEVAQYYATVGPKRELYRAARRHLTEHPVNAIVATGEPFVLFRYATLLSREFGIPWVADFRDLWSQDRRRIGQSVSLRWEAGVERRVTASASVLTTVSDSVRGILASRHPEKSVEVIPNGYDPEAMTAANGVPQGGDRLTIAFTGTVYGWHPLESVLRVFDDFNRARPEAALALKMIGVGGGDALAASIRSDFPALWEHVTFLPRMPNDQMAVELAKANVFLMFNNYAYSGTKVFDYLALNRRILMCYSDDPEAGELKDRHYNLELAPGDDEDVLARMVEATRSGTVVRDADHLRESLDDLTREFQERGAIACDSVETDQYSRRAQAGSLADLLKGLVQ